MNKAPLCDIHTHIIPGVDDGAKDMAEALSMVKALAVQGVVRVVATPHSGYKNERYDGYIVKKNFEELKRQCALSVPEVELYLGNEVYYSADIIDKLRTGQVETLAGSSYVLTEFSMDATFTHIRTAAGSMVWAGYTPVIAHAERYGLIHSKDHLKELNSTGALLQINCSTVCENGIFGGGREAKKAIEAIENGYIQFVATDCHNMKNRAPDMDLAVKILSRKLSPETLKKVTYENFNAIVGI